MLLPLDFISFNVEVGECAVAVSFLEKHCGFFIVEDHRNFSQFPSATLSSGNALVRVYSLPAMNKGPFGTLTFAPKGDFDHAAEKLEEVGANLVTPKGVDMLGRRTAHFMVPGYFYLTLVKWPENMHIVLSQAAARRYCVTRG